MRTDAKVVRLPELVGAGYGAFWRFKGRYRVVKGSRASKKSKTAALWFVKAMMQHPEANLLVVRKTYRTLKDSCFKELKWAVHRLGVDDWWDCTVSPLEMTYRPTGQKIYFRGLDDPLKVTSITVEVGVLCWGWLEEAYEIGAEADFDILDESIRGEVPEGLWKQWTLTFNPWNEHHWLKRRFFDERVGEDPDGRPLYRERKGPVSDDGSVMAITTTYECNEWLDEADLRLFESMRVRNPRRYQVAGKGNWGIVEGLVYENWVERFYQIEDEDAQGYVDVRKCKTVAGLDFGYTNDPTAFVVAFLDLHNRKLYVWDEIYQTGMSNRRIRDAIREAGYAKERIVADSAEPKSIDELKGLGLRVSPAKKGKDSVRNGIQWIQDLEIVVHPRCVNFLTEIGNYCWDVDARTGKAKNEPIDDFNHLMDALRYALEKHIRGKGWTM